MSTFQEDADKLNKAWKNFIKVYVEETKETVKCVRNVLEKLKDLVTNR